MTTVVQLYGYVDVWLCGRTGEGLYGCMAVRLATPIVFKVLDKTGLKVTKLFYSFSDNKLERLSLVELFS
jgi:hypothetical protein